LLPGLSKAKGASGKRITGGGTAEAKPLALSCSVRELLGTNLFTPSRPGSTAESPMLAIAEAGRVHDRGGPSMVHSRRWPTFQQFWFGRFHIFNFEDESDAKYPNFWEIGRHSQLC
jgi:hypothetical protein